MFKVLICEHLGISHLTGKKEEDWQKEAESDPRTPSPTSFCDPRTPLLLKLLSIFNDFFILITETNDGKHEIMDNLLTAHENPVLNKVYSSYPLGLFW